MQLKHNVPLDALNSFGVRASAWAGISIEHWYELEDALEQIEDSQRPLLVMGGGSNILFREDFPGACLWVRNRGIRPLDEENGRLFVRVAAGECWHDLVCWAAQRNLWGIENLALIPGWCGAAPIQNIGAYGVELRECLVSVKAFDLEQKRWRELGNADCHFGYRSSRFRDIDADRFIITELLLALRRDGRPRLEYPGVSEAIVEAGLEEPTALQMAQLISGIRQRKLPDPSVLGNVGSFFKNPTTSEKRAAELSQRHPEMPRYPHTAGRVKLSAAWMIDQCGWRGHREGDAGVSHEHALVLVNYGKATGRELWKLALQIQASVFERYGVRLEPEPLIL